MKAAAMLLLLAIVPTDVDGKCAPSSLRAGVATPAGTVERCETVANGTVEPLAGEKSTVFWLDAMGRKSPANKPVAGTGVKVVSQ